MKKLLLILLCLPFIGFGQVNIPDANFKAYLVGEPSINTNGDTEIQVSEATAFNDTINCSNMNIYDLTGLEAFTNLTYLDCSLNDCGNVNVNSNTALISLNTSYNPLTSLDISNNISLEYLSCASAWWTSPLTSLDLSANNALTYLNCGYNQLTSLDVSANSYLESLICNHNLLTNIDLTNNILLTSLDCQFNNLSFLDLSGSTDLIHLSCPGNQLTILDVSANISLTDLWCGENMITNINVTNNTALNLLAVDRNNLSSLDVSANISLLNLNCFNNQLTTLDVSNNIALTELLCYENQITSLDVSNNFALIKLFCFSNQLTNLDVRNGNNTNIDDYFFLNSDNPNLYCINVDDVAWSTSNWTDIDPQHYFSTNCPPSAIQEHSFNKKLLKVTDLLGRETKQMNQPLFYSYDDGTVEKRIVVK